MPLEQVTPSPFDLDSARKAVSLRNYTDRRLRNQACAECGVIRKLHLTQVNCRWRRMTDVEWAEYCGVEPPVRKRKQTNKGERMSWLNGKSWAQQQTPPVLNGKARADVSAPAPVEAAHVTTAPIKHNVSAEVARFMPVMDIEQAVARRNTIVEAMKQLMVDGVDFGKIPGCGDKPALLLPGAQKLANLFGLTLQYQEVQKIEDWTGENHGGEPFFFYQIACQVFRGEFLLAEGIGVCHSWEAKYRWRKAERTCPECHVPNIRKSRESGWYCWKKTGGCGAVFQDGDPAIEGQETGRKPNPDVFDQINTIVKMAYKRCQIHGTINATSCSEFFTQDLEDFTVTEEPPIDTGGFRPGTSQAAHYVAQQKIANNAPHSKPTFPWAKMIECAEAFRKIRAEIGETAWLGELERYGWHSFQEMKNSYDNRQPNIREKIADVYWHMVAIAKKDVA